MKEKIAIFGTSGFSKEVEDVCLNLNYTELVFIENNITKKTNKNGMLIFPETKVIDLAENGFSFIIGIGDNKIRKNIFKKFNKLNYPNIIHPSATFGKNGLSTVKIKKGNIITAGVRFTNNIKVGNFGIYNLNSTIGHDCILDDYVNIAPGVNVSGNVKIEECGYIGTNATIIQGKSINDKIRIGKNSIVGAGAVVVKDVKSGTVVVGIPAKEIK